MNGFISTLAAHLAPSPVSPAADGSTSRPAGRSPTPPRNQRAAHARRSPRVRLAPWRERASCALAQLKSGFAGEMQARLVLSGQAWQLMSAMCCPETGIMATCAHDALSAVQRWQDAREMRSSAFGSGNMSTLCVPQRPTVAIFLLHVSLKGPRTGKAPLPGNISPLCIQNELALARYARHVSEKRRKPPFGNA